jgi:hypothetical protein
MGSLERRSAGFERMPTELLELFVGVTFQFVDQVQSRWARNQYVPANCTPGWVAELTLKAQLAERVLAGRAGDRRPPGRQSSPG